MIVNIHQPDFIPWLGFFDRLARCDVFVVLDDVQLLRKGWHNRDMIKTRNGRQWLTVPVLKKDKYEQKISETLLDNSRNWRAKHLGTLRANYAKAPNFAPVFEAVSEIYGRNHDRLLDLNMDLLTCIMDELGLAPEIVMASEYAVAETGTARLVKLVQAVEGDAYLTGSGSLAYLEDERFEAEGIEVQWQNFSHPAYPQLHGEFTPGLSTIDYLMNTTAPRDWPEVNHG